MSFIWRSFRPSSWDAIELLDKMVFDAKAYIYLTSLVTDADRQEEGISAANLGELAFVREAVSLRATLSTLWPVSSLATRAVRRSGLPDTDHEVVESRRVLTFPDAKFSFVTFFMFQPHEWETRQPR